MSLGRWVWSRQNRLAYFRTICAPGLVELDHKWVLVQTEMGVSWTDGSFVSFVDRRNNPHVEMRDKRCGTRDAGPASPGQACAQQAFLEVLTEPVCE